MEKFVQLGKMLYIMVVSMYLFPQHIEFLHNLELTTLLQEGKHHHTTAQYRGLAMPCVVVGNLNRWWSLVGPAVFFCLARIIVPRVLKKHILGMKPKEKAH